MAVMQNSIIFGGINSADFGIYIGGEGTFNAPKRAVEMVTVPGRNGDIAIDQGHYENIEVTYSAFNYEEDLATFAKQLSDFRNAIASQVGYQRLTDTFHPDEYRMAIYTEGLEIDPIKYNTASEFELKFNCKPQRWLANGATAITVSDGDTLINPTQYDAGPLLITDGYGTISFNGYDIEITHVPVGWVTLVNQGKKYLTTALPNASGQYSVKWNSELLQTGDTINVASQSDRAHKITFNISNLISLDTYTYSNSNPNAIDESVLEFAFDNVSFTAGTARTISNTLTVTPTGSGSSASWTGSIRYDGDSTITFSISKSSTDTFRFEGEGYVEWSSIESKSTAQAFGRPTYIDCELGEAYKIENDEIISLNKYLDLGSDLPKLSPGANDVTTDSTITELKVVPNWWKL